MVFTFILLMARPPRNHRSLGKKFRSPEAAKNIAVARNLYNSINRDSEDDYMLLLESVKGFFGNEVVAALKGMGIR